MRVWETDLSWLSCKCLTRVPHLSSWPYTRFKMMPFVTVFSVVCRGFVSFVLNTTIFVPFIASRLNSGRETFLSLFVFAAIWLLLGTLGFDIGSNWLSFALLIRVKDIPFLRKGCLKVWNSFPTRSCMHALYYSWTSRRFRMFLTS